MLEMQLRCVALYVVDNGINLTGTVDIVVVLVVVSTFAQTVVSSGLSFVAIVVCRWHSGSSAHGVGAFAEADVAGRWRRRVSWLEVDATTYIGRLSVWH